jgi:hypothetical protein
MNSMTVTHHATDSLNSNANFPSSGHACRTR